VSIPTLKHYFVDRSGAVAAALRYIPQETVMRFAQIADPGDLQLDASLLGLARGLAAAWVHHGVGQLFTAGMSAGLFDDDAGRGYLDGVLEPTVRALEARLTVHALRREASLDPTDELEVRAAALAFLSPVLVALIHQHGLGGSICRPLDLDAFIEAHVSRFVRGYR